MSKDYALELRGLKKSYDDIEVLSGIDMALPKGTIFGYIGPNGSGKTTTLRSIAGLIPHYEGDILIEGRLIGEDDIVLKRTIGYLPQKTSLHGWRTVRQTLNLLGSLTGLEQKQLAVSIEQVIQRLGLTPYADMKVSKLSGGTLQKLGMAQAILHQPSILILDEPMNSLDPESRVLFKGLFKELSRSGVTILFSSHILADIEDIADDIGILRNGSLSYMGSMESFRRMIDRSDTLSIDLSCESDSWADLDSLDGVDFTELLSEGKILVHLDKGADRDTVSTEIIDHLVRKGCRIKSVRPADISLEDLYMAYSKGVV